MKKSLNLIRHVLTGILLFGLIVSSYPLFAQADKSPKKEASDQTSESKPEQEAIVENVSVSTVQVPVRVFKKSSPVDGMEKSDFRLFVDGKEREINDFYKIRKKLKLNTLVESEEETSETFEPRTFVLLFNFADYHQDLKQVMDYFFEKVVRKGDKLMAISNKHFFPEWEIQNIAATRAELQKIIDKEVSSIREDIARIQMDLRSLAYSLKQDIADSQLATIPVPMEPVFTNFFLSYQFILDELKNKFLSLPLEEYVRISHYLKNQSNEKYVINFFQVGRLPLPDSFGSLQQAIDQYAEVTAGPMSEAGNLARMIRNFQYRLRERIHEVEDLLVRDISNSFLSSGATFHTMLLRPVQPTFSPDFKYTAVASETETILKRISHLTGGTVTSSNKINRFAQNIAEKEDIIYMLSYNKRETDPKRPDLKIKLTGNSKYDLVYDNQKRIRAFVAAKKKIDRKKPDLEIVKVDYENSNLTVWLKNINIVNHDEQTFGMVRAHIKIYGEDNKARASIKKTFRGFRPAARFETQLPDLEKGKYEVILEVKDVFSLDNRSVGDAISIRQK